MRQDLWRYQPEYDFARNNILLVNEGHGQTVIIDNQLLDEHKAEGLRLDLQKMFSFEDAKPQPLQVYSTSKAFRAAPSLVARLPDDAWGEGKGKAIADHLTPDLFSFKRIVSYEWEGHQHLEHNLSGAMPQTVTSEHPTLEAAKFNTQVEFDRTFRTIAKEPSYQGKNLIFSPG